MFLNSRERVRNAISMEPVDRPACDFWAEKAFIQRLFAYTGHQDLDRFLDGMDVDIRGVESVFPGEKVVGNGVYQNCWGERYRYRETPWGPVREDTQGALHAVRTEEEILEFAWPKNDDIDYSTLLDRCGKYKDRAIRYGSADVWQRPALARGLENAFTDMIESPEMMHCLSRIFTDFYKEEYTRAHDKSKGRIDIYTIYSDLGGQEAPLISLSMFNEFVAPYLRELTGLIHEFGAKVLYHSCGTIEPFIDAIIGLGVDILDPIQPTTAAMQPEALAGKYKGRICFHGGIDIQNLLPNGSPGEVQKEVLRYTQALAPGYIASPAHYFQPEIPPENIIALYQAVRGDGILNS